MTSLLITPVTMTSIAMTKQHAFLSPSEVLLQARHLFFGEDRLQLGPKRINQIGNDRGVLSPHFKHALHPVLQYLRYLPALFFAFGLDDALHAIHETLMGTRPLELFLALIRNHAGCQRTQQDAEYEGAGENQYDFYFDGHIQSG